MKSEARASFENYTSEKVLDAATEALIELGYTISLSDKEAGIIQGVKKSAFFSRSEGLFMTIKISEIEGKPNVTCQVDKSRAVVFTDPAKLVKEVMNKIEKNLKKIDVKAETLSGRLGHNASRKIDDFAINLRGLNLDLESLKQKQSGCWRMGAWRSGAGAWRR